MALGPVNVSEKKILTVWFPKLSVSIHSNTSINCTTSRFFNFSASKLNVHAILMLSDRQLTNAIKVKGINRKVDNWWWMAARMWLQFDRRTTAGANCRDLTDRMGHHTWVLAIMEFKVKGINRKSWQLMMDENSENVITVWLVYNDTSKLQRPDWTKGVRSNGSPCLSGYLSGYS